MKQGFDFKLFTKETLSVYIRQPKTFSERIDQLEHHALQKFIEPEYKKEIPVNKNFARSSVLTYKKGDGNWAVASLAGASGSKSSMKFGYPLYVHRGQGKYKNGPDGGYTSGRVRKSGFYGAGSPKRFEETLLPFFKMLAKQGKLNVKPNRFADRALKTGKPKALAFISQQLLTNKKYL